MFKIAVVRSSERVNETTASSPSGVTRSRETSTLIGVAIVLALHYGAFPLGGYVQ